jgi:hypothetical protein
MNRPDNNQMCKNVIIWIQLKLIRGKVAAQHDLFLGLTLNAICWMVTDYNTIVTSLGKVT